MNIPKKYHVLIVIRTLVGFGGLNGYWGCAKYMPISMAACIACLYTPFVATMGHFILKEKVTHFDILALVTGFAGIYLINDPFK